MATPRSSVPGPRHRRRRRPRDLRRRPAGRPRRGHSAGRWSTCSTSSSGHPPAASSPSASAPADARGEILDFYVSEKDRIFPNPLGVAEASPPVRRQIRAQRLQAALRRVFGDTLLGESRVPLVIPSYNLGENGVYIFKTPHHPRLKRDHKVPMWQVAMATTAAPTIFPAFRLPGDDVRLDRWRCLGQQPGDGGRHRGREHVRQPPGEHPRAQRRHHGQRSGRVHAASTTPVSSGGSRSHRRRRAPQRPKRRRLRPGATPDRRLEHARRLNPTCS